VPHAATEIRERRMQQQMVVLPHHAMRLDSKPVEQVSQQLKKPIAMRV